MFSLVESASKPKIPIEPTLDSTPDVTDIGVVVYKGSVLNIGHCLEQSKVVEGQRDASLLKNEQLETNLSMFFLFFELIWHFFRECKG